MNEFWFQVRLRSASRPLLVVDVSQASLGLWPVFLSTLDGIAEELSAELQPDVVFLGSSQRYSLRDVTRTADTLLSQHRGRGRIISPLLDSFADQWPARVVVLAGHAVHDLADWADSPQSARLRLFTTNPEVTVHPVATVASYPLQDVESVCGQLRSPPASVRIRTPQAMPFSWDAPAYYFHANSLRCRPGDAADVRLGILAGSNQVVIEAELVHEDGGSDTLLVNPCEPIEPASWNVLSPAEQTILTTWRGGRPIHCPHCDQDHSPGEMCQLSKLFPTLQHLPLGSFVVLRVQLFQASYQPVACSTYRLAADRVLVRSPSEPEPVLWRWNDHDSWQATPERVELFKRLESPDRFLLALPYQEGRS